MTDQDLNQALAQAQGYQYAGEFRGHAMYHPPGLRTQVVPLPSYTTDWNALMPLVTGAELHQVATREFWEPTGRRWLCETVLRRLTDSTVSSEGG